MNTQEAKQKLHNLAFAKMNYKQDDLKLADVMQIINQIDEPQKPVVPQFVADWIEHARAEDYSLYGALEMVGEDSEIFNWLFNSHKSKQETFAQAWIFGYEIEQEQLYTVEIPDPYGLYDCRYLFKNSNGVTLVANDSNRWKSIPECQFTESEIKEDFEWAWDAGFAKEVED